MQYNINKSVIQSKVIYVVHYNLKNSLKSDYVGRVTTEFMDVDRLALLDDFAKNKITTSLIEASIQ